MDRRPPLAGRCDWGAQVWIQNSPHFPDGYDRRRIMLGNVDGDGLADLVYVEDLKVTLWLNQSGNRWSDPIVIHGTPPVTDMNAVRLVDLLGLGQESWRRAQPQPLAVAFLPRGHEVHI